ncbi:hypothetical protein R0J87_21100, partial [Halomonas sp. SIMBA_159]
MITRRRAIDTLGAPGATAPMRRFRPTLPLILAAAVTIGLSSCTRGGPPAPVVYGSGGPPASQSADSSSSSRPVQSTRRSDSQPVDRSG